MIVVKNRKVLGMLEKNIYICIIFTLNTCDMKHSTVVFVLLCIFACSSKDIVSSVEESVKPANEVAVQTVNLLDSLEIMDYIYSIIDSDPTTRTSVAGYPGLSDGWDNKLTAEVKKELMHTLPRPLLTREKKSLASYFPSINYQNAAVYGFPNSYYNCFAYSMDVTDKWIEFLDYDYLKFCYNDAIRKYGATYNFKDWNDGSVSTYLNAQIWGDGRPLHASRTFTGDLAYSKMGRSFVLYHTKAALQNGIYGYPSMILYPSYPYRSLSEMDAKTMKEISEDIQENIIFSQDELAMIAGKAKTCREGSRFESLFKEWKEAWNWSFSNNTASTRQLPQYAKLKDMGKEIIPLLIEKMATEEDNFFAIRLYEDLQDNPNLIIRYANDDPHQLEGLQQTTKKTIKKWLEYNSN